MTPQVSMESLCSLLSCFPVAGGRAGVPAEDSQGQGGDVAKRARALQKKLRQVQQLKERAGQEALEPEQLQKIAGEAALVAELRSLGVSP